MVAMLVASAMPALAQANHRTYGQCHLAIVEDFLDFSHSEFNQLFNPWNSEGNQEGNRARCQLP